VDGPAPEVDRRAAPGTGLVRDNLRIDRLDAEGYIRPEADLAKVQPEYRGLPDAAAACWPASSGCACTAPTSTAASREATLSRGTPMPTSSPCARQLRPTRTSPSRPRRSRLPCRHPCRPRAGAGGAGHLDRPGGRPARLPDGLEADGAGGVRGRDGARGRLGNRAGGAGRRRRCRVPPVGGGGAARRRAGAAAGGPRRRWTGQCRRRAARRPSPTGAALTGSTTRPGGDRLAAVWAPMKLATLAAKG
jgi:hypothetical protein